MTIVVTGATGHLGRLVVEALLDKNIPAGRIVAGGRNPEKLADLAARGVQIRHLDYDDPASLDQSFAGAERVLLVSGTELGQRLRQHRNVIDAAGRAGVGLVAYTSIPHADTTGMKLAAEHRATEQALRESGVPYAFLRNSWYLENYTDQLESFAERGVIFGSAGNGRVSAASRAEYAEAAAAVLVLGDQNGTVYELGGDQAFTMEELAGQVSSATGRSVVYRDLPAEEYSRLLADAGMPEPAPEILADSDLGLSRGDLLVAGADLASLLGRPTTPMDQAVRAAAGALADSRA